MNIDNQKPQRDVSLDALKGYLIILVVLGHLSLANFFGSYPDSKHYLTIRSVLDTEKIYYYHMPLFLAIGGLFVRPFSLDVLRSTAIAVLVPYFAFAFAVALVFDPVGDLTKIAERAGPVLMGNNFYLKSILWFLPALFCCRILVSLWLLIPKGKVHRRALVLLAVVWALYFWQTAQIHQIHIAGRIPFGIDIALYLMPLLLLLRFGYAGGWIARVPWYAWALGAVAGYIAITVFEPVKMYNYRVDLSNYNMPVTIAGVAGFFLLSVSVFGLFQKFGSMPPVRFLAFFGTFSFPIYLLHDQFMYGTLVQMIQSGGGSISAWHATGWALGACVAGIILPIVLSKIVMRMSNDFRLIGFVR